MSNSKHVVFVYGTLLQGEPNHGRLADATFLGAATTRAEFVMVDCGPYPALVPTDAGGVRVVGEVFAVDDRGLDRLDELEDAPRLYQRVATEFVWSDADGGGTGWVYVQPAVAGRTTIPSGDWRRR